MMEVFAPLSVLVPTGQQFSVETKNWEDVHIADELTPGFCLQPKLFIMLLLLLLFRINKNH